LKWVNHPYKDLVKLRSGVHLAMLRFNAIDVSYQRI